MKSNGNDNRLCPTDLLETATTAGLTAVAANQAIDETLAGVRAGVEVVTVPDVSGIDGAIASKVD